MALRGTIVGSALGLPRGLAFGVLIVATGGGRGIEAVTARRAALLGAIAGTVVPFGFLALTDPLRTTEPAPLVLGDLGEVLLICAVLAGLGATTGLAMRAVAKRLALHHEQ